MYNNNYSKHLNSAFLNNYNYLDYCDNNPAFSDIDSDGWNLENEIISLSNDRSPESTIFQKIHPTSLDEIYLRTKTQNTKSLATNSFSQINIDLLDIDNLKNTNKATNEGIEYHIQEVINMELEQLFVKQASYFINNLQNLKSYKKILSSPKEALEILLTKSYINISECRSDSYQVLRSFFSKLKGSNENIESLLCNSIVKNSNSLIPSRTVDLIIACSKKNSSHVKFICAKLSKKGEFDLSQNIFKEYEKQCSKIFEKGFISKKVSSFVDTGKIIYQYSKFKLFYKTNNRFEGISKDQILKLKDSQVQDKIMQTFFNRDFLIGIGQISEAHQEVNKKIKNIRAYFNPSYIDMPNFGRLLRNEIKLSLVNKEYLVEFLFKAQIIQRMAFYDHDLIYDEK